MNVKTRTARGDAARETWFEEGCYIAEWSNDADDPGCSIARAHVPAGSRTRWHRLHGIAERYVVLEGDGIVDVDDGESSLRETIGPGDVVRIPPGAHQRVQSGQDGLVFLAICTPRFRPGVYEDTEHDCDPNQ